MSARTCVARLRVSLLSTVRDERQRGPGRGLAVSVLSTGTAARICALYVRSHLGSARICTVHELHSAYQRFTPGPRRQAQTGVCVCVRARARVWGVLWGSLTRFAASITHLTFGKEYANAIEKKQVRPRPPAAVRSCARAGRGGGAGGA